MDTPKGALLYTTGVPNIPPGQAIAWLTITSNRIIHPKVDLDDTSGEPSKRKLLDEVRARIRRLNYSIRTEDTYVDWARRFVLFHGKRHPREMGAGEIEAFLTHPAVIGFDSEPGQERAAVSLSGSLGHRFALAGRYCVGAPGQAPAGGATCVATTAGNILIVQSDP